MVNNSEQSVANQFVYILHNKKGDLLKAFELSNVDVDANATPLQLKRIVEKAIESYQTSKNEKAKNLIINISALIDSLDSDMSYNNLGGLDFYDEEIDEEDFGDDEDEEDEELEPDEFDTEKYGEKEKKSWFPKINLEKVLQVGNWLINAFNKGRVTDEDASTPPPPPPVNNGKSGISVIKIVGISVGVLALIGIGVVVYKISKK